MRKLLIISALFISCQSSGGVNYPPCFGTVEGSKAELNCNCHSNGVVKSCPADSACSDIIVSLNSDRTWIARNYCIPKLDPSPLPEPTLQPSPVLTPAPIVTPTPSPIPVPQNGILRVGLEFFSCRVTGIGNTKMVVNATPRVAEHIGDTTGREQAKVHQNPAGPICTQSRNPSSGWAEEEAMENASGNPYLCQTNLGQDDIGKTYTFRAYPRPDTNLSPAIPGFQRYGEVKVFFEKRGKVICIERWNGSRFVPCPEKNCGG